MVAFFVSMEWTGQQQIRFLLQSIILGVWQGLCLDLITSLFTGRKRRRWLWTDVLFGPLAAIITFFGALVIMDGQLHPLLFFGVALGMVAEHVTLGLLMARLLRNVRHIVTETIRKVVRNFLDVSASVRRWSAWRPRKREKEPKKARKS